MSSDESDYQSESHHGRKNSNPQKKRRKGNDGLPTVPQDPFTLQPLLDQLSDIEIPFEEPMGKILPELLHERALQQMKVSEKDGAGQLLRPLTQSDVTSFLDKEVGDDLSFSQLIAFRKLKVGRERRRTGFPDVQIAVSPAEYTELSTPTSSSLTEDSATILALNSIPRTPFENSFLSRLCGVSRGADIPGLVSVDWETVTPWMSLMNDVREHHSYAHPERERPPAGAGAVITYTSLQPWHLDQVHDLLSRTFWSGIDVSDSLDYSPERCTIIATYGRLVVGVAIMSSPRETYITYLAVRAGWDNAQIATTMLYHLINLNPHQDITLHVSANSSAMLLYNRFGFKAEEFVAGFYEAYLDPQSRASKNAFRLRLRHR